MREVKFTEEDGAVRVVCGRKSSDVLSESVKLTIGKPFASRELTAVCVSGELYRRYAHEKLVIVNPAKNTFLNVVVREGKLSAGEVRLTGYVKDALSAEEGDELLLCSYKTAVYKAVRIQRIDHIRESNIVISPLDCNDFAPEIKRSRFHLFEIYNSLTKESMVVKRSHIFVDETLGKGEIRINRKQRIFLGLELPLYLTEEQWKLLEAKLSPEDMRLVQTLYPAADRFLDENAPYEARERAKRAISGALDCEIRIIPVIEAYRNPERRGPLRRLTDFYVGKSTVSLICRRPYENDEGLNVVRMARSNMRLLGIEEMDKVTLKYKKQHISCRVLELDKESSFFKTNLPVQTDLAIGVPSHIRKKLGITDLKTTIKVDRDTGFIFKRSMNEQVVPILMTVFSACLLGTVSEILAAVLSVVAVPIVLFFNLSSKRNMRA